MVGSSGTGEGCEDWCHCGDVLESAVGTNNRNGVDSKPQSWIVGCHIEKVKGNGRVAFSIGVLSNNVNSLKHGRGTICWDKE